MKSLIASVSLLALTAAAPALAQTASTPASPSATAQMGAGQALNQQDQKFVQEAAAGGIAEVEMGKLAEQRAAEPAIREFGRWMATDHELVNGILANIARSAGVTPPQAPDQEHQAMMQKLEALQGAEIGRAHV